MQKESKRTSLRFEDNSSIFFSCPTKKLSSRGRKKLWPLAPFRTIKQLSFFLHRCSTSSMLWTRFVLFLHFREPTASIPSQHKKNVSKRKASCSAPGLWAVPLTSGKTHLPHVFSHLAQPNCTLLPHFPIFSPSLIYRCTLLLAFLSLSFSPESFEDLNLQSLLQQSGVIEGKVNSIQQTVPQECTGSIHNSCF